MKLPTSIALAQDVRDALDRLADSEDRSRSWLAEQLLREGLAQRAAQQAPLPSQPPQ